MSAAAFDASAYRRTVLTPLRAASPAIVQDVFWLGDVPRELDDADEITVRLAATKAFLHKERSRPRQADVAAAVLKEWSRIEGVLGDAAARSALRVRLGTLAPGAEVSAAGGTPVGAPPSAGEASARDSAAAPAGGGALRLRQVRTALDELARIRDEPELAEDLFAFLGLPVSATAAMVRARVELVADANRKRRADRERSLVDELLMHSRELLVDGDPAAYRAALAGDPNALGEAPTPERSTPTPSVDIPATFVADDGTVIPVSPPPWNGPTPGPAPTPAPTPDPNRIDYTRRPKRAPASEAAPAEAAPAPVPEPAPARSGEPAPAAGAESASADAPPAVTALSAQRDPSGAVVLTWDWPHGVTEAFVVVGPVSPPERAVAPSRKVTNTKYEIDGGARLEGVDAGTALTVCSGRRDAAGKLAWSPVASAPATIAP